MPARHVLADTLSAGPLFVSGDTRHEILGDAVDELPMWPASEVARFQQEWRALLDALIQQRGKGGIFQGVLLEGLTLETTAPGSEVILAIDGPPRSVLWFQIINLLQEVGLANVLRCPGCHRPFVKTGKREYCGDRCQSRIYMRKYRGEIELDKVRRERRRVSIRARR